MPSCESWSSPRPKNSFSFYLLHQLQNHMLIAPRIRHERIRQTTFCHQCVEVLVYTIFRYTQRALPALEPFIG
ncbi:hypothetical protein DFK10_15180 [Salibaculum griseiflavum]|uniref:Uncharacterized protein n=1 Tax=Salibaculum griseiflavum TaxID=1914409 RepID=A0A2V1NZL3_9RHOB|nr:hypothetical protein DFK10_15180 [Salibaculum griseiflavum]